MARISVQQAGVVDALFNDRRLQMRKGTMLEIRLDRPLQLGGKVGLCSRSKTGQS